MVKTLPLLARAIAHAGGRVAGLDYTNSREALEYSYRAGFRCFELDFNRTSDGKLALIHDWKRTWARLFPGQIHAQPDLAGFLAAPMAGGLTQLCLDGLLEWMRERRECLVVADVKQDNVATLEQIVRAAPDLQTRIIAQVYCPEELPEVRALGFECVLFTIYRSDLGTAGIERFVRDGDLSGLAAPVEQVESGRFDRLLAERVTPVLVHTVNDAEQWRRLKAAGVYGIFTDTLLI